MKPEIKSITIYIASQDFESFVSGNYTQLLWWEHLHARRSNDDIELAISLDTYYNLLDLRERNESLRVSLRDLENLDLPF